MLFSDLMDDFLDNHNLTVQEVMKAREYSIYNICFQIGGKDIYEDLPVFNYCLSKFKPRDVVDNFLRTKHTREFIEEIVFSVIKHSDLNDVNEMMLDNYISDVKDKNNKMDGIEFLNDASFTVAHTLYMKIMIENENKSVKGEE